MKKICKKIVAMALACTLVVGAAGCSNKQEKKEPKPEPKQMTVVDNGNANAEGKGDGQSDVPLVIGSSKLNKNFNPFARQSQADKDVVKLTQIPLVINDRAGQIVYNGIDGEVRSYKNKAYTYYGTSDIDVKYKKKTDRTVYTITIRDDLVFSDGEPVTIDDVIFTLYGYCDIDYKGKENIGNQNIVGLLNYQANNDTAEKLLDRKVKKYIKSNPITLKNWIKKNVRSGRIDKNNEKQYKQAVEQEARRQLAAENESGKRVKNIQGIKKLDDYKLSITTYGYSSDMIYALQIPICPLHYYGNVSKYNYNKNKFGFKRGDISELCANKTSPVGAGAYRFVKYEKGIVYYTSNELYYKGCPKIAFVQIKEMQEILKASSENNSELIEIKEGTVDVMNVSIDDTLLDTLTEINSNGKASGNIINTRFVENNTYNYIGINANKVNVAGKAGSQKSKALRKAIATVLSAYKDTLTGENIIEYPYPSASWLYPNQADENYSLAYADNIEGNQIYNTKTSEKEKAEKAKEAALEYFEKAGFTAKNTKNPHLKYNILILKGEDNPMYKAIEAASQMLEEIGIDLRLIKVNNQNKLEQKIKSGNYQLWCGTCDISLGYNINSRYGVSSNIFGIKDNRIAKLTNKADNAINEESKKSLYHKTFNMIREWAVEVPMFETKTAVLFSSKRIKMDTMTINTSAYYDWTNEIQNIVMK